MKWTIYVRGQGLTRKFNQIGGFERGQNDGSRFPPYADGKRDS